MAERREAKVSLPSMDPERVAGQIGDFILERVKALGLTGGVVGLSGGVDSTTTAALAKRAFDRHNGSPGANPLELVAYLLPSKTNAPADTADGRKVAERLGIRFETHSIEPILDAYRLTNPEAFQNNYDRGNLSSRIRATLLNTKAATERKLLLGTGNRDEDFGIGYYTLFGDGAVHASPIACLSKRLVRQMAAWLGFEDLANRTPTAGLEPGQTDFRDLGYSYDAVELVIEGKLQGGDGADAASLAATPEIRDVLLRDAACYAELYRQPKFADAVSAIEDILARNRIAAGKAEIVSPPMPVVTLEYRAI